MTRPEIRCNASPPVFRGDSALDEFGISLRIAFGCALPVEMRVFQRHLFPTVRAQTVLGSPLFLLQGTPHHRLVALVILQFLGYLPPIGE